MNETKGESRELAIVAATLDLLAEQGYERLTMDAVAARARASKATIYRRWPGKPELVAYAIRVHIATDIFEIAVTGVLRDDLLRLARTLRDRFTGTRALMIGLINAAEHDPRLKSMMRTEITPDSVLVRDLLAKMTAAAGVTPGDLDVVYEIAPFVLGFRILLGEGPTDERYLGRLVDEVLLPLLTRSGSDR